MKPIVFFLIFCSVFCKGQDGIDIIESKSDTLRKVTQYAVFPGCEKHIGDNNKLYSCFAERLRYSFESKSIQ